MKKKEKNLLVDGSAGISNYCGEKRDEVARLSLARKHRKKVSEGGEKSCRRRTRRG